MATKFGRGPNGRALRKDGQERKARRTLSPEEKIAQLREMEARAYAGIGRKILESAENMAGFTSGLAIFKRWVRECKSVGDAEKREARRAYYQRQIEMLDAKGEAAENFLPDAEDAIAVINGLYSRIGENYQTLVKSGEATPDNIAAIIAGEIDADVRDIVESANDPQNDPLREFRRDSEDDSQNSEDDDTL